MKLLYRKMADDLSSVPAKLTSALASLLPRKQFAEHAMKCHTVRMGLLNLPPVIPLPVLTGTSLPPLAA
jgi:hypothetical protein